jgi:L-malate glycosyltransferase
MTLLPQRALARHVEVKAEAAHVKPARRRISICQLLHSLNVGGAEVLAGRLARRLGDRYRFVFVCLDSLGTLGSELQTDGFPVELLGRKPGLDWSCPRRLARILRDLDVDLVHAHQYTPFFYSLTARLCGRRRPILFTEHGRHQPDYPRRKRMLANRLLLSRRDRVVGVGAAVRKALIDNEGLAESRVSVLHNGIDVDIYAAACDREKARHIFGVGSDEFVMIQVARLDYLKDHLTAVRTLARVVNHRPQTRLVLIGDGPERPKVEAEARKLGVFDKVIFLGTRHDVAGLLGGADLFLLTSISEGIPLTVLEAMAAGLPVVATNVGGMAEIVTNETGQLAPAGDDAALADAALRIAATPDLGRRMGEAGWTRVKQRFDEPRMCADYASLYEELAAAC